MWPRKYFFWKKQNFQLEQLIFGTPQARVVAGVGWAVQTAKKFYKKLQCPCFSTIRFGNIFSLLNKLVSFFGVFSCFWCFSIQKIKFYQKILPKKNLKIFFISVHILSRYFISVLYFEEFLTWNPTPMVKQKNIVFWFYKNPPPSRMLV